MHLPLMYLFACLLVGALAIPGAAASSHVYGPEDSGSEINILVGDTIVITLPENPTTGFMWNFSIPEGLLLLDDRFIPPDRVLPGAGGERSLLIRADIEGTYQVRGVYYRPWLEPNPDDMVYLLVVNVTAGRVSGTSPGRYVRMEPVAVPRVGPGNCMGGGVENCMNTSGSPAYIPVPPESPSPLSPRPAGEGHSGNIFSAFNASEPLRIPGITVHPVFSFRIPPYIPLVF